MPSLRVFISSTMRDLDTERRLVRQRIKELNFEPVNAEDIAPTGQRSWERIEQELESCNVMVLLQGASSRHSCKSGQTNLIWALQRIRDACNASRW